MLRLRILTAIALLAVLLPAVFYPDPLAFACVAGILMACAAWEWFRLNGASFRVSLVAGFLCAVACAGLWSLHAQAWVLRSVWLTASLVWVLGGGVLIRSGLGAWAGLNAQLRQGIGFVVLCMAWMAVTQARIQGINFLFSVMALVWVADIAAYFAGRSWGGQFFEQKLAPSISPGKTREGAVGGLLGVVLLAVMWVQFDAMVAVDSPSLYTQLGSRHWAFLILAALFLGVMSICGDLLESLVKRVAGAKDSSQLLPGHGGVLDRVDALLPVLPLAMLLAAY